ncbi:MAG: sigma-70 family RNA polymerase sigma factor [Pseudomonadota bacterium]
MSETGSATPSDITELLLDWQGGSEDALEALMPKLYSELRQTAEAYLYREREEHTLQPTALVNEAYLKIHTRSQIPFESRQHFFAVAAKAMRQILVDHARKVSADKRFSSAQQVTLPDFSDEPKAEQASADIIALDQAIERLANANPRQASVVELRYFGGMTTEEVATVLEVSGKTVRRDWKVARTALRHWLAA